MIYGLFSAYECITFTLFSESNEKKKKIVRRPSLCTGALWASAATDGKLEGKAICTHRLTPVNILSSRCPLPALSHLNTLLSLLW